MIRSMLRTAAAATFALTALANAPASAITLTVQGGTPAGTMTCDDPSGSYLDTGSTPVVDSINCSTPGSQADGSSSASAGHVGAAASASGIINAFGARIDATGIYSDTFVFHSTNPVITTATIQLGVDLVGLVQASGPFATASVDARVTFTGAEVGRLTSSVDTTGPSQCTSSFVGGAGCGGGVFTDPGLPLLTQPFVVGMDSPLLVQLRLDVDTTASNFGSGSSADFFNSLDFPIGTPLFVLPDGVTVNAPDSFVFDNIFAPPGAATAPEPATLALLGAGLAALGLARRRTR